MFFRNLTLFTLPAALVAALRAAVADGTLQQHLAEHITRPIGACETQSEGWAPPFGAGYPALYAACGPTLLLTVAGEVRKVPPSVVAAEVARRIEAIEEAEGKKVRGRARRRLCEEVFLELLPRAFPRPYRVSVHLDLGRGFLAVDTSSRKAAEQVISGLRATFGSFAALPVSSILAVRQVLTGWLAGEPLPDISEDVSLARGDAWILKDPGGEAVVRFSGSETGTEEVEKHLASGLACTRISLVVPDHLSFDLDEDLVIRRLRFLDGALQPLENLEIDSIAQELEARFALQAGELRQLWDVLKPALSLNEEQQP